MCFHTGVMLCGGRQKQPLVIHCCELSPMLGVISSTQFNRHVTDELEKKSWVMGDVQLSTIIFWEIHTPFDTTSAYCTLSQNRRCPLSHFNAVQNLRVSVIWLEGHLKVTCSHGPMSACEFCQDVFKSFSCTPRSFRSNFGGLCLILIHFPFAKANVFP